MNKKTQVSKSLSWLLRHGAHKEKISISPDGFVLVEEILQHKLFKGRCRLVDIEDIVKTDAKQRYTLRKNSVTGQLEIRANQGHSIVGLIDLELTQIKSSADLPNHWVVHGTYHSALPQIMHQGLSKMSRTHIHFCPYEPGDQRVVSGLRKDIQVLVYVDVDKAIADGINFYMSSNKVVVSEGDASGFIRSIYFLCVKNMKTGANLL